ncbi:MAG TPA: hypothetical protein VFA07_07395 [Chthonomonadaceae bacterium]|nr:hypothetical protein [Chthonomonadaceae bacterium]
MDPLEEAHLAFIRGNVRQAYDLVESVLKTEPENDSARRLLAKIEKAQMEDITKQERTANSWLATLDPDTYTIIGMIITGIFLVIVGIVMAIHPILLGFQRGFSTQIVVNPDADESGARGHFPIHILLAFPCLFIGIGAYLLYSVYRYLRD